ncbi:MAG TPA: hypothetical protein VKT77_08350, partial [Chthonomonadaceae bacterium]|nr:hypothetical protein [Chthonomonadaceae bacterium]
MSVLRISETAHRSLREIARMERRPMQAVLDTAIEAYRRQAFLKGLNADFAALRSDAEAWREEESERA